MCGIAGIVSFRDRGVEPRLLERMIRTLGHRGPDASGVYADRRVGLAHARLSIIDLSGGQQPMHNESKSTWITFNGEIFNYVELREELELKGHRFATKSDTEVILHLYDELGEDCVSRMNGQWAFAIWDETRGRLFVARDRLGVRPLFYTLTDDAFVFASEMKAILAHPAVTRNLDLYGLDQIFTFWFTLPPRTVFQGILELPPGHVLTVQDGKVQVRRYWRLDFGGCHEPMPEEPCADRLLELLTDATRIRLRSDVPVGAYLSGGIDSTVITALIRGQTGAPLKSFSITFDDPEFDEESFQREAVAYLNTEHESVRCTYADIGRIFPAVIWHAEKPILRTAPAPLWLLSQRVHEQGYKVVLTGEGSDEMLGGYDIFKEAKIRRFWAARPQSRMRPLLLKRLYPYLRNLQSQSGAYLSAFFRVSEEDLLSPLFSHLPRWELTSMLKLFFSEDVKDALRGYDACAELAELLPADYFRWDGFSQAQYLEASYLLPGYILSSQGDRMSMAHSVEGRHPFLDYRVVEFAATIPPSLKMKVLNEKYILKRAAAGLVPRSIAQRPKQPYRAPEAKSFFGDRSKPVSPPYVECLLSQEKVKDLGIFDPVAVRNLVEKAKKGQTIGIRDNMAVVGILSTQLLAEQFIRNSDSRLPYEAA